MYEKALKLAESGVDLIHLEVGRPSFDTPAAYQRSDQGRSGRRHGALRRISGNRPLRDALRQKSSTRNNRIAAGPDQVVVTNGLTHAAYVTCMAALDPGDEVILLEPYYPQHINKVELAGGRVVTAALDAARNFSIDEAAIRAKITDRTRMIAIVNPVNPTGRVYTRDELDTVAAIAIEHDLLVMSDEVYEQIVFDGNEHISIASLPGMAERTVTQFAFTKAYAMDGWRLGYLAAPGTLHRRTAESQRHGRGPRQRFHSGGRARRDRRVPGLRQRHGCRRQAPPGSHLPSNGRNTRRRLPDTGSDHLRFSGYFGIRQRGGRCRRNPRRGRRRHRSGYVLRAAGEGHLRLCFGSEPIERIDEAMDRIAAYFASRSGAAPGQRRRLTTWRGR